MQICTKWNKRRTFGGSSGGNLSRLRGCAESVGNWWWSVNKLNVQWGWKALWAGKKSVVSSAEALRQSQGATMWVPQVRWWCYYSSAVSHFVQTEFTSGVACVCVLALLFELRDSFGTCLFILSHSFFFRGGHTIVPSHSVLQEPTTLRGNNHSLPGMPHETLYSIS